MFDIGWPELVVILIVAIVVIGPRDLPKAFYTVGKWVRAARRVTADFQRHVDDMVRETELEDLKKVATQARSFNVKNQIENAIDPSGELKSSLELDPAETGKPVKKPATPGVPVGAKADAAASDAPATPAAPKPAAKAAPAKTAAKASPKVASRVPKKSAAGAKSTASKTPTSEQAS